MGSGTTLTAETTGRKVLTLLVVALIFGVVNAIVKPIFTLVTAIAVVLTLGLFLIVMPTSAFLLTRTGNFVLERSVRWGILAVAAIILVSYLDLSGRG